MQKKFDINFPLPGPQPVDKETEQDIIVLVKKLAARQRT